MASPCPPGIRTAAAALALCLSAQAGATSCCDADATLRGVVDHVTFAGSPLLRPADRGRSDNFSQARLELSARGPVDQPDADLKWAVRAYVRTDRALGLADTETPAFVKVRQAVVAVPVGDGELTAGRIVAGSGTLRTRNLVDYLDAVSVHTETRSGFLPERLDNRIGQVGAQLSQMGSLGAVQWLLVPRETGLHDSNAESLSLLRVAPAMASGTASVEALWFWSRRRAAYGAHGTVSPAPGVQVYGEISRELRWPQMQAGPAGIEVSRVHATLAGGGVEFKPNADWTLAVEALHNDRPAAPGAFDRAAQYLATATLPEALAATSLLNGLPYGFQQPWFAGALVQYQWPEHKLTVAASHYRALSEGSSVSTLQAKWTAGKQVELSVFARSTHASAGQELQFVPEARRFGAAANFAF